MLVQERLREYIFSTGETSIDEIVAELFQGCDLKLATAESCTGGMIAQRITSISGSSRYFLEGAVTYCNDAKVRQLGVDAELLKEKGAVSFESASAMAKGVRAAAGSHLGLAVTGIAGPDGGTDDKPVGTVFISLAAPDGCWTKRFRFSGSREEIRVVTTWTALNWLRRYLQQQMVPEGRYKFIY
jgi:nicotinamide-nucleotide amidase